jgi:hypothetical protein
MCIAAGLTIAKIVSVQMSLTHERAKDMRCVFNGKFFNHKNKACQYLL